jgi:hypothetical protein
MSSYCFCACNDVTARVNTTKFSKPINMTKYGKTSPPSRRGVLSNKDDNANDISNETTI